MVRFPTSAAIWGTVLNRGRRLLEGDIYSDLNIDGARLIWNLARIIGNTVRKNFRETSNFYPLAGGRASACQRVRIASFSESFSYTLNEWTLDIFLQRGMPMVLVKFGTESMFVEMFKEINLEEMWFTKSKTTKFPHFVRRFKFSCVFLIIF